MFYLDQIEHIFSGVFTMANRISTKQKLVTFTSNVAKQSFRKKIKKAIDDSEQIGYDSFLFIYLFMYVFSTVYQHKYFKTKKCFYIFRTSFFEKIIR